MRLTRSKVATGNDATRIGWFLVAVGLLLLFCFTSSGYADPATLIAGLLICGQAHSPELSITLSVSGQSGSAGSWGGSLWPQIESVKEPDNAAYRSPVVK